MSLRIILAIAVVANIYSICYSYSISSSENVGRKLIYQNKNQKTKLYKKSIEEEAVDNFMSSEDENAMYGRKALRSPSLRLRFGRTDPNLNINAGEMESIFDKRSPWIGEVNQKPIRSPSLRLRFGRRSDPSIDIISKLNSILNEKYQLLKESRKPSALQGFGKNSNLVSNHN